MEIAEYAKRAIFTFNIPSNNKTKFGTYYQVR